MTDSTYADLQRDATPHERIARGLIEVGVTIGAAKAAIEAGVCRNDPLIEGAINTTRDGADNIEVVFGDATSARLIREALDRHLR